MSVFSSLAFAAVRRRPHNMSTLGRHFSSCYFRPWRRKRLMDIVSRRVLFGGI